MIKSDFLKCFTCVAILVFSLVPCIRKEIKCKAYTGSKGECVAEVSSGRILFSENGKTLCVVPGFSFDKEGFRLGYGGGYYDRFLSTFNGFSAGLCLSAFISEKLPRDGFDIAVNAVITEE